MSFHFSKLIVLPAILLLSGATSVFAAGECAKITKLEERLLCIEKKADNPVVPKSQNVMIESASRTGQCLTWIDNNSPPLTAACGPVENKWNFR